MSILVVKRVLQDQPETLANAGCQLWDLLTPLPKQCQPTFRIWQRGPKLGRWTVNCPCIPRIPCQLVSRVQFIYIKNARPRVVQGTRVVVMYLVQIIRKAATSCISTSQIAKDVGKCQFHRVLFQNHSWRPAMTCSTNSLICFLLWLAGMPSWAAKVNMASRADWLHNGILCLKLCNFGKSGMAGWKHFLRQCWSMTVWKAKTSVPWPAVEPAANMASKHVICRFGTHCLGPGLASCSSLAESCAHNAVLLIQTKKPLQANGFQMIALEAKTEKQQAEPRAALQVSGHLLSCWKICLDKYVQRKPKRFCFPPLPVWFTIAVFAWLFTTRQPTIFCQTKEMFTLPFVPLLLFLYHLLYSCLELRLSPPKVGRLALVTATHTATASDTSIDSFGESWCFLSILLHNGLLLGLCFG